MFDPVKRATFLYPSGPDGDPNRKHLCILLTDPVGPAKQVLTVSVMTLRENKKYDQTCILKPGDHEFIRHDSLVAYATCRIDFASRLIQGVVSGEFVEKQKLKDDVFSRVIEGIIRSRAVKPFALQFFKESR